MVRKNEHSKVGYDAEELYFDRLNRELINKMRSSGDHQSESNSESMAEVIELRPREDRQKKAA